MTAVVLTWIAGFVDALGYLALYHIYVANMSGNSISIGIDLTVGDWRQAIHRAVPVAGFIAGLMLADVSIELFRRAGVRRLLAISLSVEAVGLAVFLVLGLKILGDAAAPSVQAGIWPAVLVAVAAIAMGAQNTSLRAAIGLHVYTTHVTGGLTQMSREMVRYAFALLDGGRDARGEARANESEAARRPARARPHWSHPSARRAAFLAVLWAVYVVGAAVGAVGWRRWGLTPMLLPLGALAGIIAVELVRPLRPWKKPDPGDPDL